MIKKKDLGNFLNLRKENTKEISKTICFLGRESFITTKEAYIKGILFWVWRTVQGITTGA